LHQEREEIWKGRELMERKKRLREEIKEGREEKIRKEENKGKGEIYYLFLKIVIDKL
jgi:hypothetical protein